MSAVAILAIIAVVAIPNLSSTDPVQLDLAAENVAEAMRFARSEAMRLGTPFGVDQVVDERRVQVFRVETGTTPWSPVWDVYHPLSKNLYDLKFNRNERHTVTLDSLDRSSSYRGTCQSIRERYYFDAKGTPWCLDPNNVSLDWYKLTLRLGSWTRTVTLHGVTGRVTVQ